MNYPISAGLLVVNNNNQSEEEVKKELKKSSKKINAQTSIQNLKIVKPQVSDIKLPKIKKISEQPSKIEIIDLEKPTTRNTSRRKNGNLKLELQELQKQDAQKQELQKPELQKQDAQKQDAQERPKTVAPTKPKQVVRKNTITQLNHVPFPERKIIFSIDPGRVNFACRLEERKEDGTIIPLLYKKMRFEELLDINQFLDEHESLLSQTTICIVEKQMSINYTMIRVSQHVETYFLTKYPLVAVYEISAKLKVEKELTISTAKEILAKGKDQQSLDLLERLGNPEKQAGKRKPKKEKLDDYCDTICQIEAFLEEMKRLEYKVQQGYVLQTKSSAKK